MIDSSVAWLVVMGCCLGGGQPQDASLFNVEDVNPAWLESIRPEIMSQLDLLTSAYGLDDATRQDLIRELQRRLEEEVGFQRTTNAELDVLLERTKAPDADPKAMEAVMEKFQEIVDLAPLNEDRVARWVEEQLPPGEVAEGRKRLMELRHRRVRLRKVVEEDQLGRMNMKRARSRDRRWRKSLFSEHDNPLPFRKAMEQKPAPAETGMLVHPGQGAVRRGPGLERRGIPVGQLVLKCSPLPLDEWNRYMKATFQAEGVTSEKRDACEMILISFTEKAQQYVQDHHEVFEPLAWCSTPEAYRAALAELKRNTPIDAFFAEMQLRVEKELQH